MHRVSDHPGKIENFLWILFRCIVFWMLWPQKSDVSQTCFPQSFPASLCIFFHYWGIETSHFKFLQKYKGEQLFDNSSGQVTFYLHPHNRRVHQLLSDIKNVLQTRNCKKEVRKTRAFPGDTILGWRSSIVFIHASSKFHSKLFWCNWMLLLVDLHH